MKCTKQYKKGTNKSLFKKFTAILVTILAGALMPFNSYAQCPTSPPPAPPCPNANQKTIYSNVNSSSGYDWMEAMGVYSSGEQMTIRPAAFGSGTNLFVGEYLFRTDGGRIGQLSPIFPGGGSTPSYSYGLGNRWNFLGDDLQSPLSHSSSGTFRRVSGFHNFDNKISTVFGSYTDNIYATTLVVDPVLYWQSTNSTNKPGPNGSRLRFIYKDSPIYPYGSETELATLTDSGNFGLNSTSPLSRLELLGGLYVGDQTATIAALPGFIYANGGILMGSETFISSVPNNVFIATYPSTLSGIGIADPKAYLHVFNGTTSGIDGFKITNTTTGGNQTDGFSINMVGYVAKIANYENASLEFFTNNTQQASLHNNGDFELFNGTGYQLGSTLWTNTSDRNLKKDIKDYTTGLDLIMQVKPVRYRYNGKLGLPTDKEFVGVIAQDIQKFAPQMIIERYDSTIGTYLNFNGSELLFALINSAKQLKQQNDELKSEIEEIKNQLQATNGNIGKGIDANTPKLYQNNPIPFENKTTIKYFIPESNNSNTTAQIIIRDNSGNAINTYIIDKSGEGAVVFEFTNSTNRIFYYSLVLGNNIIDTKIMIKN